MHTRLPRPDFLSPCPLKTWLLMISANVLEWRLDMQFPVMQVLNMRFNGGITFRDQENLTLLLGE